MKKDEAIIYIDIGDNMCYIIDTGNDFSVRNIYQDDIEKDYEMFNVDKLKKIKKIYIQVEKNSGKESISKWQHKIKKNFTKYYFRRAMEHMGIEAKDNDLLLLNGFDFNSIDFVFVSGD